MTDRTWRLVPFSAPVRVVLISLAFSLLISVPVLLFVYHQTDVLFEQGLSSRFDDRERNLVRGYQTSGVAGLTHAIQDKPIIGIGGIGIITR